MSFPQRKSIKSYLTENKVCKIYITCYSDGTMETVGQFDNIFNTGNVEYWLSLENPIKPLTLLNDDIESIPENTTYFNTTLNKGNVIIIDGQFKFSSKFSLQSDLVKFSSSPIYVHLIINISGKEPISMDIKMDMVTPMRIIDNNFPNVNPFSPEPDNNEPQSFYNGYKNHEYHERRKKYSEQHVPSYGKNTDSLIDLPSNKTKFFGLPCNNMSSMSGMSGMSNMSSMSNIVDNIGHNTDFRKTRNVDIMPINPYGR
jgi:hypothetical protein